MRPTEAELRREARRLEGIPAQGNVSQRNKAKFEKRLDELMAANGYTNVRAAQFVICTGRLLCMESHPSLLSAV